MTTAPTPQPVAPNRRGPSLALRFAIAFLAGIVLVIGVGAGALYAYGQQYTGRVLPGVKVGGVDLAGLTVDQARDKLAEGFEDLGGGLVTLTGPNGEVVIGYGEIGRRPDVDAMLASALTAGRQGEGVADLLGAPQTALRGVTLEPVVTYDEAKLADAVAAVAATIDRDPVDATLVKAENGDFVLTESVEGRVVDQAALLRTIDAQVARLDAPGEIREDIPMTLQAPAVETADAQAAKDAGERMAQDIVLKRGSSTWTIPATTVRSWVSFTTTADGSITPVLDTTGVMPEVKKIAAKVDRPAVNATFKLSGGRIVFAKAHKEGRRLSRYGTEDVIIEALMARQAGQTEGPLAPVVVARDPVVTTADAKAIAPKMRRISTHTTYFPITEKNGFGANIWIPAKIINGFVVGPGETFDFWEAVGPVTRAKGYKQGGAIIDGKTEPQGALAGGICSCSTTLFNAALKAGFPMGARRNHYYYIDRYPLGLDATVFISASGAKQTMSWTNDTANPVLIRGINTRNGGRGYVTFSLYSVPTGRTVSLGTPTVKNVKRPTDTIQYTSSLPKGTSKRIEYPVEGKDVWRTVTVRQGGKVISKRTYYSHYSVITGITLVGTGGSTP
jgi:vancomycin resistance protein YoaR